MALDFTTSIIKLNNQYTIVGTADEVEPTTVPKKGELYFLPENSGERTCKIGDGKTQFQHLPVIGASSLGLEATSETENINLDYNGKYKLNVGNKNIVFKMPPSIDPNEFTDTFQAADYTSGLKIATGNNTPDLYVPTGTSATTVALGNHAHSNYALVGHTHTISAGATDGIFNITGTAGTNKVTYAVAPYSSRQSGGGKFDTTTTNPTGTTRLNWDGYLYATKLYSGGTEVATLSTSQALTNKTYNGYTLAAACAKAVTDSSPASAISTGTSLVTERDVYYGLPKINNSHSYTSSTSIYAPTAGGTSGYVLVGNGTTSAPTWTQKLPIANGGTGATDAATARANLGTATMSTGTSTTSPAFPSGSAYGTTFSRNSIVNTTAKNDNYMLHVSSTGDLYTGYQINSMTTPTWTKVSLDGHKHSASDLTSGTLSIARGGTGVTSTSELRNVLGLQRVTSLSQTKSTTSVGATTSASFSAPGLIVGYSHNATLMTGYNGTTFTTSISGNVLKQSMIIKFSTGSARSVSATLYYIPVG